MVGLQLSFLNSPKATTIFAADEDIQEGQLIVFLILHRKLNVREDGVELFFESQHLIPFDDDEVVIHIPSPEFRSVVSENQRLQPLKDRLGYESRNRRTHWRSLHLLVDCSVECKVRLETELQEQVLFLGNGYLGALSRFLPSVHGVRPQI
nr:unnamed protein product [Spirometra erinaceieuropaei]